MSYLFVDSTYDLAIGVLDDGLKWREFERHSGVKVSAVVQDRANALLRAHGIRPVDLAGLVTVNGPGFYTGLRLAEGFADVLRFFGVRTYSFYTYEIPRWCGYSEGVWFTKAYRGEYFMYRWRGAENSQKLVGAKELPGALPGEKFFIHSEASLDALSAPLIVDPVMTADLIRRTPELIFSEVLKGLNREPFYFRAPEDEFKVNP